MAPPAPSLKNQNGESHATHSKAVSKSKPYFSFSSSAVPLSGNIEEIASKILSEGNFRGGRLSLSKQGNEKGKKNESEQAHQCFILSTLSNADLSRNYQFCVSLTSNLFYKYLECWQVRQNSKSNMQSFKCTGRQKNPGSDPSSALPAAVTLSRH